METIEFLRELEQIVGTACLVEVWIGLSCLRIPPIGSHREHLAVRLTEHLTIAHTTSGVDIASLEEIPEIVGDMIVVDSLAVLLKSQGTDDHRYVLIGMTHAYVIDIP